jgi:hypothetical protein
MSRSPADGRAHLVYTHDPEENGFTFVDPETGEEVFIPDVSTTAEDGDIRYIRSSGPPFGSWSAPVTLNDDGLVRAQGYPALETSQGDDGKTTLHVLWEDHRRSPEVPADSDRFGESSNLYYDIFTTSHKPGRGWSRNTRVTDKRSISDFLFIGDYFDITTSGEELVFGIRTDRRHQTSTGASVDENGNIVIDEAALEDNVFGARLRRSPGPAAVGDGQVRSNSPVRTPPRKASHSRGVNRRTGPPRSLESRTATRPSRSATSTQPLRSQKELVRHSAAVRSSILVPPFVGREWSVGSSARRSNGALIPATRPRAGGLPS